MHPIARVQPESSIGCLTKQYPSHCPLVPNAEKCDRGFNGRISSTECPYQSTSSHRVMKTINVGALVTSVLGSCSRLQGHCKLTRSYRGAQRGTTEVSGLSYSTKGMSSCMAHKTMKQILMCYALCTSKMNRVARCFGEI